MAGFLPQNGKFLPDFLILIPMSMFDNAQNEPDSVCYRKHMDPELQDAWAVCFRRIR